MPKVIHLVMLRLKFELRFSLTPRERLKGESGVGMEVREERPKNGKSSRHLEQICQEKFLIVLFPSSTLLWKIILSLSHHHSKTEHSRTQPATSGMH